MVAAIRQTVTVQTDGRLEIHSPELKPGAQAEVIVLLERSTPTPAERIAAFEELQRRLNLDAATAAKWIEDIRAERESFGPRS